MGSLLDAPMLLTCEQSAPCEKVLVTFWGPSQNRYACMSQITQSMRTGQRTPLGYQGQCENIALQTCILLSLHKQRVERCLLGAAVTWTSVRNIMMFRTRWSALSGKTAGGLAEHHDVPQAGGLWGED